MDDIQYFEGISLLWRILNTVGILSVLWRIFSAVGHTICTMKDIQHFRRIFKILGNPTVPLLEYFDKLQIEHKVIVVSVPRKLFPCNVKALERQ